MMQTALYDLHLKLSAKMVPFSGYSMPLSYSGVPDEHLTVRSSVGLFDISHMGRFEIEGEEGPGFLDRISTAHIHKLPRGGAQYGLLLRPDGGIIDDIYIYRRGTHAYLLIVNAANRRKDWDWLSSHLPAQGVSMTDQTEQTSLLAVQGPRSWEVIQKIIPVDTGEIALRHFVETDVVPVRDCMALIARTGYTGEKGYELLCPSSCAPALWETLLKVGRPEGIKPIGLGARDTLRLEMGYRLYGHDINEKTSPVEADLLPFVDLQKDFVGKEAVVRLQREGTPRRLIGFEMLSGGIPREGHLIFSNGKQIGTVTSGNYSPSLRKGIGIGYIDVAYAQKDSELFVDIRGRVTPAVVVGFPFYKKKKR